MAAKVRRKKSSELISVREALAKKVSPLSKEEIHIIRTCCHILKASDRDRIKHISATVVDEGQGDPGLTIIATCKLLEELGSEVEVCRRASPAPYLTTRNADNLEANISSLKHLQVSSESLREALQHRFIISVTKSWEDFQVTVHISAAGPRTRMNSYFVPPSYGLFLTCRGKKFVNNTFTYSILQY